VSIRRCAGGRDTPGHDDDGNGHDDHGTGHDDNGNGLDDQRPVRHPDGRYRAFMVIPEPVHDHYHEWLTIHDDLFK